MQHREFSICLLMTTTYCYHGKNEPYKQLLQAFLASQRNHRATVGETGKWIYPAGRKCFPFCPECSMKNLSSTTGWSMNSKCGKPFALQHCSAGRRSHPLRVSWLVKFNVWLQKTVWTQKTGVRTQRNLWEWLVWPFSSPCVRKDIWGHAIHSFGLCLLHFPLHLETGFLPTRWVRSSETIHLIKVDLESPLKERALTLLNSYFQKHKTYQNTCQDQLSHSVLSNLLPPNCNFFSEMWVQTGKAFKAKWEEIYLCLQFAMVSLFTLWSSVNKIHVLQNISKKPKVLSI